MCHRMLIASVAELLQERKIVIVPDRSLNRVPYASVSDKDGKYLTETFRIRIVPSLTTLKLRKVLETITIRLMLKYLGIQRLVEYVTR